MRPRKLREGEAKDSERVLVVNRQARFRFELLDKWQAGLVLLGTEVKSLRAGTVDLSDAYVRFSRDEAWLANCRIGPYAHASVDAHEPLRDRKLLLHRLEIDRLAKSVQQKGLTVVPLRLYFAGPRVKVEIALARGRKTHDKREAIKKREMDRDARRNPAQG